MSLDVAHLAPQLIGIALDWYHGHSSATTGPGEFPSRYFHRKPESRASPPADLNRRKGIIVRENVTCKRDNKKTLQLIPIMICAI